MKNQKSVLLIFTGGTISMSENPETGALQPLNFNSIEEFMPELSQLGVGIKGISIKPLVDSSDIDPDVWEKIAFLIADNYNDFDGFVVLHGTDTMSYTASALSFMLSGLTKPVVFTGSQIPIGKMRTDAKENLITAIEIASQTKDSVALVPEVTIFFEDQLFRANRTTKQNSENFNAFSSFNYPVLAEAGIRIRYFTENIRKIDPKTPLKLRTKTSRNIAILKIFPGITENIVSSILSTKELKAVVLESFGAGNAPQKEWFYNLLKQATDKGIIIVNKSQCMKGSVEMGFYQTSLDLIKAGVISGYDITTEALVSKLMYLLGEYDNNTEKVKELIQTNLCGEITGSGICPVGFCQLVEL